MQRNDVIASRILASVDLSRDQVMDLLIPFRHSSQSQRQRCRVINSRVQLIAAVFAVFVPAWIVLDYLVLPDYWQQLGLMRMTCAALFLLLALPRNLPDTPLVSAVMVTVLFMVPPVMYLFTVPMLLELPATGLPAVMAQLYGFLPYIVMAGLCIFPLTALESTAVAVPVFGIMMFGSGQIYAGAWEEQLTTLWLLGLIFGISVLSGMSHLQYMIALVNRVTQDDLTGAFSRRTGSETLELLYRVATVYDMPIAVVFVDIDDFKSINDRFGHDEGDNTLCGVVNQLRKSMRRGDSLIRWGGEEFLLVLNNTDLVGAQMVIERVLARGFGYRPDGSSVTASMGVAERIFDEIEEWRDLVDLADRRMYAAKRQGKNRAVLHATKMIQGIRETEPVKSGSALKSEAAG